MGAGTAIWPESPPLFRATLTEITSRAIDRHGPPPPDDADRKFVRADTYHACHAGFLLSIRRYMRLRSCVRWLLLRS